ncbi:MAG: DUF4760 domain-containing protein [Pseudomonadota bacterium]
MPSDHDTIRRALNFYEATAVGMQDGSLVPTMIRQWWRKTWVLHYIFLQHYIRVHRDSSSPKVYENFEYYAWTWADHTERADVKAMPQVVRDREGIET